MNHQILARRAAVIVVLILATLDAQWTIAQDTEAADIPSTPPPTTEPAGSQTLLTRGEITDTLESTLPVTDKANLDLADIVPIPALPDKLAVTANERHEQEMLQIFESDEFLPDSDSLPAEIVIRRRVVEQLTEVNNVNGVAVAATKNVVRYQQETVQPTDPNLNAEQRLGVIVAILEEQLRKANEELNKVEDDEQKTELLNLLRDLYWERFAIDTAYQDYKVRKIEQRAAKLRAEVISRQSAGNEWVEAMVTLAKMRASGIETMPAITPTNSDVLRPSSTNLLNAPNAPFSPALPNAPINNGIQTSAQTFFDASQPENVLAPPIFPPR